MADDNSLLITLGVDSKGTTSQISAINKELKALDKEFKSANSVSKDFEKSAEGLRTKLSYLENSFQANNTKLDAYRRKMEETKNAIRDKEAELQRLNSAETVNQSAVNKATEQLERMRNSLRSTEQNISLTENELRRLTNEINATNNALSNHALDTYRQRMQELGNSIQGTGSNIKNAGEHISGVGTTLLALSAPLVAVGIAAAKVGMDFDSAMSRVKAISGATGTEFEKLKTQAIDLGASTAFSAKEAAEGMENLASAGFSTNEIMEAMPGMLDLAASSGEDLASSADIAASTLRGFGLEASQAGHVADVLAKNAGATNAAVADTGEAMKYVAPVAHAMGLSLEEVTAAIGEMANAGIKGSQAGTTLRSALTRLASPTDPAAQAMDSIGFSAFNAEGKLNSLSTIIGDLQTSMEGLTDKEKEDKIATIFGQEAMSGMITLIENGSSGLDELTDSYKNCDGAASDMAKTMQDNAKSAIEQMFGSMESAGIKLEQSFAPVITNVANKVGELADKFSELSPETQQAIVKFTALTVATGGILTITGKVVSGVGTLVTSYGKLITFLGGSATEAGVLTSGLSAMAGVALPLAGVIAGIGSAVYLYNKEQDALNQSVVTSSEEMGTLETTLSELNGVHIKSKEELQKLGLVYKDFNENISDEFKTKVEESTDAINDFNFYLGKINMDGVLTEEETSGFNNRVDKMCNTAIESIKGKQATTQAEMSKMFTLGDGVLDESEQQVLDYLNKNYSTNITEITKLKDDVNAIYKKGIDEKRSLNEDEIKDIQDKTSRIKQIELEALANNEQEQLYAKNNFLERVKTVDADGAKDLLIAQKKTLDEQNSQTLASYDTQIETMKIAREKAETEGDEADKTNLDKQITAKTEERDKIIEKQRETWQGCIDVVEEMNPNLVGTINKYSGEILTNADLNAQKGLTSLTTNYDDMNTVTKDGWTRMKNTTTGNMDDIYVTVNKNTGEITGAWNETTGVVGGYTDEMKQKVKELGQEHEAQKLSISQNLGEIAGASINTKDEMVNALGEVIGQLQNVTTNADGTRTGIINLNGTPMQITTNADGVITSMQSVKTSVDNIPSQKTVSIDIKIGGGTSKAVSTALSAGLDGLKQLEDGDGYEVGTYSAKEGFHYLNEDGWELARNKNITMFGDEFGFTPSGSGVLTHMQSVEEMKAEVSKQINSLMLSGGYYNRDSLQSQQLVNNSNVNNTYNTSSSDFDYEQFANIMSTVMGNAFSNMNINVDSNGMVDKWTDNVLDKLNRQTRNNNVSKGR